MADPQKTYAAIDIGTNSAHLVVARYDLEHGLQVLDTDKVNLRLGQSFDEHGNLSQEALENASQAVSHMCDIVSPYKIPVRVVATHAARQARNQKEFVDKIADFTGAHVQIIDGMEEARLVFLGMRQGLPLNNFNCLGCDVGGGSTEMVVARDDDISCVSSIKLGAVVLTDRFLGFGNVNSKAIDQMEKHIRLRLTPVLREIGPDDFETCVASSGTAKALAAIHAKLIAKTTLNDPNGYILNAEGINKIYTQLKKLKSPAKIKKATGLDSGRSEIILAGAAVLKEITDLLDINQWIITTYGLREGIVVDSYHRQENMATNSNDVQWRGITSFARRLGLDKKHSEQISRLAGGLYTQLQPVLNAESPNPEMDLRILQGAAYLHESGKFISAPQYHKHSNYLIQHSHLPGFTETERKTMGLVTRFQRKSMPHAGHKACSGMSGTDIKRLVFMTCILRLASSLDRTRQNKVQNVTAKVEGKNLDIVVYHGTKEPIVEMNKLEMEKRNIEKSLGLTLQVSARLTGS